MDLAAHFAAIWRHKWAVLVGSLAVAGATYGITSNQAKVYQASSELTVTVAQANTSQGIEDVTPFLAETYASLATTRPVLQAAVRNSGLNISESTAADRTAAQTPGSAGFIELTANGPSPQSATALGRGLSQALISAVKTQQQQALQNQTASIQAYVNQLGTQLQNPNLTAAQQTELQTQYQAEVQALAQTQAQALNGLSVVSPSHAGSGPVSPLPKRDAALAFVVALVVLAELSVGYELLSDRFSRSKRDEEITRLTGLPVLAQIPRGEGAALVEAFRTLRTSLLFTKETEDTQSIAVVSTAPQVGKSFISIHLADSFADLGVVTTLVDGDMRRPSVARELGIPNTPGLSDAMSDGRVVEHVVSHLNENGRPVLVLPAGSPVTDPAAWLTGKFGSVVLPAFEGSGAVVVDTPAEGLFPDASIIASRCDATVLAIDPKRTKRRSLKGLVDHMRQVGANPVGVVVNRADETAAGARRYYFYSRDGHEGNGTGPSSKKTELSAR